jgi:predicted flap endonuclease-1-like 5' DNA nuclease
MGEQAMPAFTTTEWAILFLVFLLGWLLGLISRSNKKWRNLYESERDARIEAQAAHDEALAAANARNAELEARLPVAARTTPADVAVGTAATPGTLDLTRDDLTLIRGVSAGGERRLNAEGIHRFTDVANMTPADERALEDRLGMDAGYIEQEQWREQAALLAAGKFDDHRSRFS